VLLIDLSVTSLIHVFLKESNARSGNSRRSRLWTRRSDWLKQRAPSRSFLLMPNALQCSASQYLHQCFLFFIRPMWPFDLRSYSSPSKRIKKSRHGCIRLVIQHRPVIQVPRVFPQPMKVYCSHPALRFARWILGGVEGGVASPHLAASLWELSLPIRTSYNQSLDDSPLSVAWRHNCAI